jgi:hypothetical protein
MVTELQNHLSEPAGATANGGQAGRRSTLVEFDKKEMIEKLKLEIEVMERGGYQPSVREPRRELHIFRDSVTCLNFALDQKREPCEHCFLSVFVPPEHMDKEEPCHHIPLNARGDTIVSLEAKGDPDKLRAEVLAWLKATVARLQSELAASA